MNYLKLIITSVMVLGIMLTGMAGCGSGGISQEDYDAVKDQLADYQEQLAAFQDQMDGAVAPDGDLAGALKDLQSDYDALNYRYEQLKEEMVSSDTSGQLQALQDDYDELNQQYQDLLAQQASGVPAALDPEAIEQAVFKLVNEDRQSSGIAPLTWGPNIYKVARSNSGDMVEDGDYHYSDQGVWQRIHIASGLSDADEMARAALTIWKNNTFKYDDNVANPSAKYGAVSVVKSGDVYYITFVASTFK